MHDFLTRHVVLGAAAAVVAAQLGAAETPEVNGGQDSVVELRQYTLHQGKRETLLSLFEQHFIEPQNALGAHVRGTFRDLDDPDRFVWLRGFADLPTRQKALEAFYGGPVWRKYRGAANATMLDSDNVLLLRPIDSAQTLAQPRRSNTAAGLVGITIYYLGNADAEEFVRFFNAELRPRLVAAGVAPIACLVTEEAPNNYPRLPVREHERVFVWIGRWKDAGSQRAFLDRWAAASGWRDAAPKSLLPAFMRKPEILRLAPTSRSALR